MCGSEVKPIILAFIDYYFPGYKGGGPIRTLVNIIEQLGNEFSFKVLTRDRDMNDAYGYTGIRRNAWNRVGRADVFYLSPDYQRSSAIHWLLTETSYDILYLNSFFSPMFTIKPLMLRRLRKTRGAPVIVAPRGEFSPGALAIKRLKKSVYINLSKLLGLYDNVIWQASSEHEESDIRRWFGTKVSVRVAPDMAPNINVTRRMPTRPKKAAGCLKILFLSRISRMKNLDAAINILNGLPGEVHFNIYGPLEDHRYWQECQTIMNSLSPNIKVKYHGEISHDHVSEALGEHDLLFLPTIGENFGHVILEALCAGCPVLISDQTPWRDLKEKGVGWDLPLDQPEMFQEVLQRCVDMDGEEYLKWSERAREYGIQISKDDKVVEQNRQLFQHAVGVMRNNR